MASAVMGATLSAIAWFVVAQGEDRAAELEFTGRANNLFSALQSGINEYFGKVRALRALFESAPAGVSRSEFDIFANRLLEGQEAILSVTWIPRVLSSERAAHELMAARDGLADYHIRTVAPDGALVVAAEDKEYFPVYYTTYTNQKVPPERVFGLDLGDGGLRERTLARARDGNLLAASDIFQLQTGAGDRKGFFVVLPVFKHGLPHSSLEERRNNLLGFVQGVFQASVTMEILAGVRVPVDLYIFPPSDRSVESSALIHVSTLRAAELAPKRPEMLEAGLHWNTVLNVGDKRWKVVAVPASYGSLVSHARAWTMFVAGILVTGGIVAFLWRSGCYAASLLQANRRISEQAHTDALTSLANRRAFLDRVTAAFAAGRRGGPKFSILYLDLDHFKDVNDTLGHSVGDALLRQAAERIGKTIREGDLAARFGGDEFAVLQSNVFEPAGSGTLAARLVETLAEPYFVDGNEIHTTGSVGISHFTAEEPNPEALLMQADLALYRAKEDGRDCFRFHSKELDEQISERVSLSDDLRTAIERGQIELYYQPQVEIGSGRIVGVEALARWTHPKRGVVPPSVFIPIAERSGAIVPLGKWIFDEACRQTKIWQDEGIAPRTVAVNFSTVQCKQSNLLKDLAESLKRWKVEPGVMEVELTETVLMEATQEHRDTVERMQKLGVRIAIDDFGTGYSSLSYLTAYPVDRLKIAQELVFRVTADSRHASVVRTAIRLADELGIEVIAEGVESNEQASFLAEAGCDLAQGYNFSPPVPVERATELLRRRVIQPAGQPTKRNNLAAA